MPLTGLPWAGPPPFDQVKRSGLFTGMGLWWAVPRCNTPDVTFHICNSNSCHFRLCAMIFPSVVGFCLLFCILFMSCISYHVIMSIAFAYVFVSCIRAFSPLSVLQSGASTSSGAPLLFSFVSGCQTFSEWTEACQVALVYHPESTGQVSFHSEVVWYSNG